MRTLAFAAYDIVWYGPGAEALSEVGAAPRWIGVHEPPPPLEPELVPLDVPPPSSSAPLLVPPPSSPPEEDVPDEPGPDELGLPLDWPLLDWPPLDCPLLAPLLEPPFPPEPPLPPELPAPLERLSVELPAAQ
jgi:hypothetical protein